MARSFNGTNQYLQVLATPVVAPPFSWGVWINPPSAAPLLDQSITFDGVAGNDTGWRRLLIEGNTVLDRGKLRWAVRSGTTGRAQTAGVVTANVWQHACGIERSTSSRDVYLNGTSDKGSDGSFRNPFAPTATSIGFRGSLPQDFFTGLIAHAALWNVGLTDGEVDALASGVHPLRLRRDALVGYWPLNGQSPEIDIIQRNDMALFNAPPLAEEFTGMWGNHIIAP